MRAGSAGPSYFSRPFLVSLDVCEQNIAGDARGEEGHYRAIEPRRDILITNSPQGKGGGQQRFGGGPTRASIALSVWGGARGRDGTWQDCVRFNDDDYDEEQGQQGEDREDQEEDHDDDLPSIEVWIKVFDYFALPHHLPRLLPQRPFAPRCCALRAATTTATTSSSSSSSSPRPRRFGPLLLRHCQQDVPGSHGRAIVRACWRRCGFRHGRRAGTSSTPLPLVSFPCRE
jgi:hypothetical protein